MYNRCVAKARGAKQFATPNVNLLPTQSHNLKYCSNVINESGHKLGSMRWDIGASLIRYRLISLPSHYEKSTNLHLHKFLENLRSHS